MVKKRKLEYRRETVANLSFEQLARVQGGAPSNSKQGVIKCQTVSDDCGPPPTDSCVCVSVDGCGGSTNSLGYCY